MELNDKTNDQAGRRLIAKWVRIGPCGCDRCQRRRKAKAIVERWIESELAKRDEIDRLRLLLSASKKDSAYAAELRKRLDRLLGKQIAVCGTCHGKGQVPSPAGSQHDYWPCPDCKPCWHCRFGPGPKDTVGNDYLPCPICGGSGWLPDNRTDLYQCDSCGQLVPSDRIKGGMAFGVEGRFCGRCRGVELEPCWYCNGIGKATALTPAVNDPLAAGICGICLGSGREQDCPPEANQLAQELGALIATDSPIEWWVTGKGSDHPPELWPGQPMPPKVKTCAESVNELPYPDKPVIVVDTGKVR